MVVIFVLRLLTGNIIGAILPLVLAAIFASVAFDFPLWSRLRKVFRLVRRVFFGSK
jgi:hypothetical protein